MRYTRDGEALPGSERERPRYKAIPTLMGDIKHADPKDERFAFRSWAASAAFRPPEHSYDWFCHCESTAEVHFLHVFAARPGVVFTGNAATDPDGTTVRVQVRHGLIRLDSTIETIGAPGFKLAVEVDGFTYHTLKFDRVEADYLRQRRVTALGYSAIRFTAREVLACASECWRQIDAILAARRGV